MSILSRVSEALNPRHLAVQWTREGRVSGLLRAILHELPTDSDGTVALEVDGQAMFEAPFRADADGKANLTIHTHLLQNGPRKLRVRSTLLTSNPRSLQDSLTISEKFAAIRL